VRIRTPYSYYGGKSKIAHLYPVPAHELIVEPFAGSAAYSWLHRRHPVTGAQRDVWLNDLDAKTYAIWAFLTSAAALDAVELYVPDTVHAGQKVSDIIPPELPGLVEICRSEANQGTQGAKGTHDQITSMGAKCWKVKRKLREVIPEVSHWKITNVDYTQLANVDATWFVDPPYSNAAGARYRTSSVDYQQLGWWCLTRKGQVVVCEGYGADWLPFERFNHQRVSIRSRYQKANSQEVVWVKTDEEVKTTAESNTQLDDNPNVLG
jgi:hypothetical protein